MVDSGHPVTVCRNNTWPADNEWCLGQEQMAGGDLSWARRLAAMEHKAGIEQVTGHRLGSGRGYGSGCEFRLGY